MEREELIRFIAKELDEAPNVNDLEFYRQKLVERVNQWLNSDFQRLISLLYRVDVDEGQLRKMLHEQPGVDAGQIIADLIIERQIEKIKTRQQYMRRDNNISEDEAW